MPRAGLPLTGDEVRALGGLTADAGAGIARLSGEVHEAVADRVFGALSLAGVPIAGVRGAHDAIARVSYAGARALTGGLVQGAGAALALTRPPDARPLSAGPRGVIAQGALGGVWGDRLRDAGSPLAPPFTLLVDDRRAPVGDRVVVFVHGLGESDRAWRRGRAGDYGATLADELGLTPVYARFNSGAGIAPSGAELADALTGLVDSWPLPVASIALVGHSLGGLVIAAACECGRAHDAAWVPLVRQTVALGSPHAGAPLARAAAAAERVLGALPETRPFAAGLRVRSAGIRDLEHGLPESTSFLPSAEHYLVSASVSRAPDSLADRMLGDLLVQRRSAWGQRTRTERLRFPDDHYRHLDGASHFDLLGHPALARALVEWLGAPVRPALNAQRP